MPRFHVAVVGDSYYIRPATKGYRGLTGGRPGLSGTGLGDWKEAAANIFTGGIYGAAKGGDIAIPDMTKVDWSNASTGGRRTWGPQERR